MCEFFLPLLRVTDDNDDDDDDISVVFCKANIS
jgi:hypothetical protein